jgi:hypothetical protein
MVYQKIWKEFELDKILNKLTKRKTQFNLNEASFLMAIQHLLAPKSKLSTYTQQNRYLGILAFPKMLNSKRFR